MVDEDISYVFGRSSYLCIVSHSFAYAVFLTLIFFACLPAIAQTPICGNLRAELADAEDGNSGSQGRLLVDLDRVRYAIQQNDCTKDGWALFSNAPPICKQLKNKAAQLESELSHSGGGRSKARIMELLEQNGCFTPPSATSAAQKRGVIYAPPATINNDRNSQNYKVDSENYQKNGSQTFFERLFDTSSPKAVVQEPPPSSSVIENMPQSQDQVERLGGRMPICVRTCDGSFFPINFEGVNNRDDYTPICRSLCPAAETQVFFMPPGGDLDRAAARDGTPYSSLANAKRYQSHYDSACFCKQPKQTWAEAMKGVEDIVSSRKGDIIVTPEQAIAMSRIKGTTDAEDKQKTKPTEKNKSNKVNKNGVEQKTKGDIALPTYAQQTVKTNQSINGSGSNSLTTGSVPSESKNSNKTRN